MIDRKEIKEIVEGYYAHADKIKIGAIASHSGLDICDGAVEEDFRTLAVCQAGREKTYTEYFRAQRDHYGRIKRGLSMKQLYIRSIMKSFCPEPAETG